MAPKPRHHSLAPTRCPFPSRSDIVLIGRERDAIQDKMTASSARIPKIILGRRSPEWIITVAEERGRGERLPVTRAL
jgi:hypothetical protein